MKREFKYYPEDFGALSVKVLHFDLLFNISDDHTDVTSDMKSRVLDKPITELELNAKALELKKLTCSFCSVTFEYDTTEHKIHIHFSRPIPPRTEFTIHTESVIRPTKQILAGLYFDVTPPGKPPTMITQCQQWDFERIVPCIDDMTAKSTYRTTIIADNRYTSMISNGDVEIERKSYNKKKDIIVYNNTKTPMAPYLFFLGVGTYDVHTKEFEYPDGSKFDLELVVFPGSDTNAASRALDILYDAVMWVYVFTGPKKYEHIDTKKKIWELIKKRDVLKAQKKSDELKIVRAELNKLIRSLTLGYQYTGTVYREIAAQNFTHGGMENVGNTVITGNRIMPYKEITDAAFEYMIEVKLHEFFHNINGSEVTGRSPFEFWLNESVTELMQEEYAADLNGENYQRLGRVIGLLAPGGVFEEDSGVKSVPIEPDGFNDPEELVGSIVYVKGPEFVRMIRTLMGKEKFMEGLWSYYAKFKHSNASRADWIKAMEDASGQKFTRMAQTWLKQSNYPLVTIKTNYDEKTKKYALHLTQSGFKPGMHWEFPFAAALFDKNGKKLSEKLVRINDIESDIVFANVSKPAFVSLNRDYAFYGKVQYDTSDEELLLQVKHDDDVVNRYMAFYQLADKEKMRLLKDTKAKPSDAFIELYHSLLTNKKLLNEMSSLMLALTEGVEDEKYNHRYQELYDVREKILKAIAEKYKDELLLLYREYDVTKTDGTYVENEVWNIKKRGVKNACLGILSKLDTPDVHKLIKRQFDTAQNATDKVIAFSAYLKSSAKDRLDVFHQYEAECNKSLVGHEIFLARAASSEADDVVDLLKHVVRSKDFNINHANDQRAVYEVFSNHKRIAFLTKEGREFLQDGLIKISQISEYNAQRTMDAFGKIDYLEPTYQVEIVKLLNNIWKTVTEEKQPSVYNTIRRILLHSPKARAAYEKVHGKLKI